MDQEEMSIKILSAITLRTEVSMKVKIPTVLMTLVLNPAKKNRHPRMTGMKITGIGSSMTMTTMTGRTGDVL